MFYYHNREEVQIKNLNAEDADYAEGNIIGFVSMGTLVIIYNIF
jgi:hypothetical protein